ncbi:M15 family metallopeptidase [Promicromonospora sp. NPDC060271]|uniref:M15 family metallopeptidase n=1 Tax=Promicromonospora sp. NPDC060271 TaxID=3347089 RepID=UPI0036494B6C
MTAGGLLFTVSANVPPGQLSDGDGERFAERHSAEYHSAEHNGEIRAEPAVRAVPADVSVEQIVALLERAEKLAREQGPDFSPAIAQAAAELGMLYTTYQAQQRPSDEQNGGLRVQDAPVARAAAERQGPQDVEEPARQEVLSAVAVSYVRAAEGHSHASGRTAPEGEPHEIGPEIGLVTYDQVTVAAVRLAGMLDRSASGAPVEVQRAGGSPLLAGGPGRPGSSLRSSLDDVVAVFGDSTLGYANGRIPAAVLCDLEFAPGHMLRCDAAERLTALSEKFERRFGYPIPITDSYRTYVEQISLAGSKPHLAAVPGTSNHGWGLAVDLSDPISGGASPEYTWLRIHGPDYGWDNPSWARPGGAKPEPWHFEFFAAGPVPDRAVDPSDVDTWGPAFASSSAGNTGSRAAAAADRRPKDDSPGSEARQRPTKPKDEPSTKPPAKKPAKPAAKPKPKPSPSEPKPKPTPTPKPTPSKPAPKPTAPPTGPDPSPVPSPTPVPSDPGEEPSGSPSPSTGPSEPSPSEPSQQPTSPTLPETSPSPSAPSGSLSDLTKGLGLSND